MAALNKKCHTIPTVSPHLHSAPSSHGSSCTNHRDRRSTSTAWGWFLKDRLVNFSMHFVFWVFFPRLGLMCFVLCFQVFVESPEGLPCVRWRQQHRSSSERGQWRRYEWLDHTSCNTFHHLEESCWGKENSYSELFHCRNIQQTGLESSREFI